MFAWWNQPPSRHHSRIRLNRRWREQIIQFFAGEIGKLASLGTGYLIGLVIVIELVSGHAKLYHSLGNRVFSRRFRLRNALGNIEMLFRVPCFDSNLYLGDSFFGYEGVNGR